MKLRQALLEKRCVLKSNPGKFFDSILNIRNNRELVIMATGPTINDYTNDQISNFCKEKDVFGIKQTFFDFENLLDIHFFNCSNLPINNSFYGYEYKNNRPFVVCSSNFINGAGRWSKKQEKDIFFKIPTLEHNSEEFLFTKRNLANFKFENSLSRPCGPGIFFETVLYFAIHLGYKKIYTIGWDYSGMGKDYGHYYNNGKKAVNVRVPGDIFSGEIKKVIEFSDFLHDWLSSIGIELEIIGNKSLVSKNLRG